MNLMFRKNFREGANKSGGGGGKLQSKANRTKRSRDIGLMQQQEEIHYRTHLFFSPNRSGYEVGEVKFGFGDKMDTTTSEPISMAMLNRDCLIIPIHSIDRFLPAGLPVPAFSTNGNCNSPLNVLEIADPKLCLLVHLMSPLEAIDPLIESPLSYPLAKQRSIASELLTEVQQANTAVGGMLLANMEKASEFPFISYYLINTIQTDPSTFYAGLRLSSLSKFEPKVLK
ncbi:uncharacterized protein LOC115630093 isoform X2 [Scaptodrosophila lebanonensis]|uniref:Uncharacterized protein LOC115630093 isoform X2 n=1 Tax=Drosophila lebanonensis TaxID=7225 RepID=A0A6J2U3U9_DROLE|nr:uncharacterized protein LOC115630093 isoform X2 [Scaptodrosophila lebanonensis]